MSQKKSQNLTRTIVLANTKIKIGLDLLYKAPELLRHPDPVPARGSQRGDVYSFAIIVQEFHTRDGPWSTSYLDPRGNFFPCMLSNTFQFKVRRLTLMKVTKF